MPGPLRNNKNPLKKIDSASFQNIIVKGNFIKPMCTCLISMVISK